MMRVVKVLNTSVVLAVEEGNGEVILMGKGIGFRKSIGQTLAPEETDRVFVLRDRETNRNILQLAAQIDGRIFEITRRVVEYARSRYQMELMDHIYLALTDHLAFAVKRQEEGLILPGTYVLDVKRFNPREYDVGRYARLLVETELNVVLPEDEISNIAFHFINAQRGAVMTEDSRKMSQIVKGILEIVKYSFSVDYNEDSVSYSRFLTHLQALAHRLVHNLPLTDDLTDFLYEQVVPKCPAEYRCTIKVGDYLKDAFAIDLSRQEALYLTIHIHRVLEEHRTV